MACARAGVVGVPLSRRLTAAELEFQLAGSGAAAVMFSAEFAPLVAAASNHLPALKAWIEEAEFERGAAEALPPAATFGDIVKAREQHPELPRRIHSVRLLTVAGSLLPAAACARATAILGPVVGNIYGLTEAAGPVTFLMPHEMHGEARTSVGRPNPFIELAILDDHGRPTDGRAAGEIGLAGPQVTPGYWQRPPETRAAFAGRWLKTGDIAWLDQQGRNWLGDRMKDMIESGGCNVKAAAARIVG